MMDPRRLCASAEAPWSSPVMLNDSEMMIIPTSQVRSMRNDQQPGKVDTIHSTRWREIFFLRHFYVLTLLSILLIDTDAFVTQYRPNIPGGMAESAYRRLHGRTAPFFRAASGPQQDTTHAFNETSIASEASSSSPQQGKESPPVSDISYAMPLNLTEVDVSYGSRKSLVYDERLERYVPLKGKNEAAWVKANGGNPDALSRPGSRIRIMSRIKARVQRAFLPEGVTPSYYRFIQWRIIQRFINANVHVFGTQSLLLGLGIKSKLGLTAALNWVLKDALGKIVRMAWASKMGRKFDSDAKRWRFRSSLVFALGNGLEIVTYIFPGLFLIWATLANCCKQVSMLTSSSTRNSIYNSFRDGSRENIGDITAKGEAQIAVVDLLGIASGVTLSKAVGMSVKSVLGVYIALQVMEIVCMYQEISAVEFRVLNFERLMQLVNAFVSSPIGQYGNVQLPTPSEMAKGEKIFLPPKHLARRAIAFGSLGRAKLAPDELQQLMDIFRNERFLLVVGEDVKNPRRHRWNILSRRSWSPEEHCHIVLHADASNVDITKSTLALCLLRQALKAHHEEREHDSQALRTRDCIDMIYHAYREADRYFPTFLKTMSNSGWASPVRFMFGRVTMRAEWELKQRQSIAAAGNGGSVASKQA